VDVENTELCKYTLKEQELTQLRDAIEDLYYFEFVIGKFACFLLTFAIVMWIFACTPECDKFRKLFFMLPQQPLFASLFMKMHSVYQTCLYQNF